MGLTDSNGGLSAADVAAVMNGNGNNGWGGFGGDGAWWILILFMFAFLGNGWGNGFGNGGGGGIPYVANDVQRGFDQSAVMSGISGIQSMIGNGFADAAVAQCNQTASLLQGVNAVQNQLASNQFNIVNAISQTGFNLQNQMMSNEMARQQCCCDTKQAISDLKYTVATENCADRASVSDGIRDIIAAQNANTQALLNNQTQGIQTILDKMCQQEIDALKTQNANLQTQVTMQNLAASQAAQTAQLINDNNAQTAQLINRIAPYPVPSYQVANPYVNNGCGCGYNGGCGCGTVG